MERPGLAKSMNRCEKLRWKGMFIKPSGTLHIQHCNDRSFWCHKPQIPLGPDGQIVDDYECHEGRNCFREL